ncbi:hypothetical protein QBC44DRAFT_329880 [Cladorrhinum sp. PSN332]|nr:hypothetical protein QBC44DRAFT_329880 [Cladorrhinum sp. PSN332]
MPFRPINLNLNLNLIRAAAASRNAILPASRALPHLRCYYNTIMSSSSRSPNPPNQSTSSPSPISSSLVSPSSQGSEITQSSTLPTLPTLPAPDVQQQQQPSLEATTTTLKVNGAPLALDALGPMVVGRDGTLSRIGNWAEMSEFERANTLRILGKGNQLRLANLREQEQSHQVQEDSKKE